jgi:hypothetical protein
MPSVEGVDDNVPPKNYGVNGLSQRGGYGIIGFSDYSIGVYGVSRGVSLSASGVFGSSENIGVYGGGSSGYGVGGVSFTGYGVLGQSKSNYGMIGESDTGNGMLGWSLYGDGVVGSSNIGRGVVGESNSGSGVFGSSGGSGSGVFGSSPSGYGVYAESYSGTGVYGYSTIGFAAFLDGKVYIRGPLQKPGGSFKIDHPLDPANKYLSHSFVKSPDMKNIYDGVVALDDKGEAEIELPDWFGALNKDFRYQLTAIGAPGPNLYIAEEISDGVTNSSNNSNNNRFKIAGGTPGMKVSWHVTGIRKDPWANAHRIQVEEAKPDKERGYYIYPELYGQPAENEISRLLSRRRARAAHK